MPTDIELGGPPALGSVGGGAPAGDASPAGARDEGSERYWSLPVVGAIHVECGPRSPGSDGEPAFITDDLAALRRDFRGKPRHRQDNELVARTVTLTLGPWRVVDPAEPYDWSKR